MPPIATIAPPATPVLEILALVALGIVVVLVAGGLIFLAKRKLLDRNEAPQLTVMEHLREMRASGAMTPEEYEQARKRLAARIVRSVKSGTGSPPGPRGYPGPNPDR